MSQIYTVTLNNNGATSAGTTQIYVNYGVGIYLDYACTQRMTPSTNPITTPTKTNYFFGGYVDPWDYGEGEPVIESTGYLNNLPALESFIVNLNSNVTLNAVWYSTDPTPPQVSITTTNNMTTSQTVTLIATDNVGLSTYYWGTSSSGVPSTSISGSSWNTTKTVTAAGQYYFRVKDTAGNLNSTSIIFYRINFSENHGSTTTSYMIIANNNYVFLPAPTAYTGYFPSIYWTNGGNNYLVGYKYLVSGSITFTNTYANYPLIKTNSSTWKNGVPYVKTSNGWTTGVPPSDIFTGLEKYSRGQVPNSYTLSSLQGWVGLSNDSWSGITSFSGSTNDIIYIPAIVTDQNNEIAFMKCKVNSYDSNNNIIYVQNQQLIFKHLFVKTANGWLLVI